MEPLYNTAAFAAAVASQVNDELTVLLNELSLSLDLLEREHPATEVLNSAHTSALRLACYMADLLRYTNRTRALKRPVTLRSILAQPLR